MALEIDAKPAAKLSEGLTPASKIEIVAKTADETAVQTMFDFILNIFLFVS